MPSKLVLPSASVLSSSPPRLCLPWVLTGCMITAALRTGLPLSSLSTRKFRTAVGSSSVSFCAAATPSRARAERKVAIVGVTFIFMFHVEFICGHSSECGAPAKARSRDHVSLRLSSRVAFALRIPGLACKLHQIGGDPGRVVTGDAGLFQVVSQNRDDTQSLDGFEIDNDLAGTFERVFGFELIGNRGAIDQGVVEELPAGVAIESADVIGSTKAQTLVSLGHQVTDVNLGR